MKKCSKCKQQKEMTEFHKNKSMKDGFCHYCKSCKKESNKLEYNPEYHQNYYKQNLEKIQTLRSEYRSLNKIYFKNYLKKYVKSRKEIDLQFKLQRNLRIRLNHALKNNQKDGSAVRDLGCSIFEFKCYLESQFKLGMTWENYGPKGWHIDHKKPLKLFDLTNPSQLKQACHFTNLQPLWATENYKKGAIYG